jgi:signal transduction histidine kinase
MIEPDDGVPNREAVDDRETQPMAAARRILVVDDRHANLVAMQSALAPLELSIACVASGRDALAALLDEDFSLLLLDVHMPDMDGFETASLIRGSKRTKHLPIIFMTAQDTAPELVRRAYQLGAVDFLFKPIDIDILLAKARVFVTLQQQADALAAARLRHDFELARRAYEHEGLRRQMAALAEDDRRKDRFIALLSHELRNPLAAIRSAVDLQAGEGDRPVPSARLAIVDRQVAQLTRLVDDLLDLSRIKADKLQLKREVIDLQLILEIAVAECRPAFTARSHAFVARMPASPVYVHADPARLAQVIANLLANACRYTQRGGHIALECDAGPREVRLRVRDDGVGIAPEMLDRIFDPFVQERERDDSQGGLGLGLSLARRLVEMHGGRIAAESTGRGAGSMFEVVLPVVPEPVAAATVAAAAAPLPGPPPDLAAAMAAQLTTLVVDDNPDLRELLAELIAQQGHEVLIAGDASTASTMILERRPDVAFVDLGMPVVGGLELARSLRASCPELPTRLVALTGFGLPADLASTKEAGFYAHLVKPVAASTILDLLRALQLARAERA